MKKIRILLLLLAPVMLVTSCQDDDNNSSGTRLTGTWKLTNVSGGLLSQDTDFPEGTITWKFNTDATVDVVNNNPADSNAEDFFETGTYDYEYVLDQPANNCDRTMRIDDVNMGCEDISNGILKFTQTIEDGYVITLKK